MGLGQLMPDTARMLGVSDPFDTEDNIDGAARLMASHLARYRRRLPLAIAAYHAGPGAVRGRVPQNGQTPGYVAKVMRTYDGLRPGNRRAGASRREGSSSAHAPRAPGVTASGTRRAGPRSARWARPGGTTWPGTGTAPRTAAPDPS